MKKKTRKYKTLNPTPGQKKIRGQAGDRTVLLEQWDLAPPDDPKIISAQPTEFWAVYLDDGKRKGEHLIPDKTLPFKIADRFLDTGDFQGARPAGQIERTVAEYCEALGIDPPSGPSTSHKDTEPRRKTP